MLQLPRPLASKIAPSEPAGGPRVAAPPELDAQLVLLQAADPLLRTQKRAAGNSHQVLFPESTLVLSLLAMTLTPLCASESFTSTLWMDCVALVLTTSSHCVPLVRLRRPTFVPEAGPRPR